MDISEFTNNYHWVVKVANYCENFHKTGKKFKIFYKFFLLVGAPWFFSRYWVFFTKFLVSPKSLESSIPQILRVKILWDLNWGELINLIKILLPETTSATDLDQPSHIFEKQGL